jgi:fructose-1,6-bisphosphatase/inositol monophosphatase family enzyme
MTPQLQEAGFTPEVIREVDRLVVGCGGFVKELISYTSGASTVKDSSGQRLSAADDMVDLLLRERLMDLLPACSGYSEEGGEWGERQSARLHARWMIDPLDGTRPALLGGAFAVSAGVVILDADRPVAALGWVYVPTLPALYRGIVSDGFQECTLNGQRVTAPVHAPHELKNCYFAVGSDWDSSALPRFPMKLSAPGATAVHLTRLVHPDADYAAVSLSRYKPYDALGGVAVAAAGGCRVYLAPDSKIPEVHTDILEYAGNLAADATHNGPRALITHPQVASALRG